MIEITPFISITLFSIGLALTTTVIYRVLTNPAEIRKIKEDAKFYKKKMGEAQKAGDKQKTSQYANEMLKMSQKQMKHSMKPMIATMLMFVLLLGWLNANFGGVTANFNENPNATFNYGGSEHAIMIEGSGENLTAAVDFNDDGSFSDGEIFRQGTVIEYMGAYWRAVPLRTGFLFSTTEVDNAVHFEMLVVKAPFEIPFLGSYLSWFWWYIFISIPCTIIFRRLMGVE